MRLQHIFHHLGVGAVIAAGPVPAWAAEGGVLGDNLPVLGVVAALLIFALTRKPEKSVAPPAAVPAAEADPVAVPSEPEAEVPAEEPVTDETPSEPGEPAASEEAAPAEPEQPAPSEENAA
ncbi:hypothetical protein SAMN02949497_2760 [Methylomagnum ishizawai]|uniref:Uncharacterized protein n=1 Tax=Methylomagnum ishizawai TaxID=1760988 RepID=A0A1Y6CYE4_9GAMM|nr:hypothetical protein [Methylomagnum ishizawai]SMF95397.1 hypothetical protein SAMN02949497_2760 [Methylomagnum ishizawai]